MLRLVRIVSLLLLLTCSIIWMRSYRFTDELEAGGKPGSILLTSQHGRILASWPSPVYHAASERICQGYSTPITHEKSDPRWGGLVEADAASRAVLARGEITIAGQTIRFVQIPIWGVALLTGIYPVIWLVMRLLSVWRRRWQGRCRICGYDLRATPAQCPECGTPAMPERPRRVFRIAAALCIFPLVLVGARWLMRCSLGPAGSRVMSVATLGGFAFDQDRGKLCDVPLPIRQLDGHRITLEGNMIPMDDAVKITIFAIVPRLWSSLSAKTSCRGEAPLLQQTVVAYIPAKKPVYYWPDRIAVTGILHVRVTKDVSYTVSIFEMDVEEIRPAPEKRRW